MNAVDRAIADFREIALLPGHCGDRELLVPAEQSFSGMWSGLCDMIPAWEQRFGWDNPVVHEVRTAVYRLADQRPDAVKVFALNTTEYGRERA